MNDLHKLKKNYVIFDTENDILLFDYFSLTIVKINEEHKKLLNLISEETFCEKNISNEFKKAYHDICVLAERGIAFHPDVNNTLPLKISDFFHAEISFPTVHKCNLNCKYCFAEAGNKYSTLHTEIVVTEKVIEKALEYLVYIFAPDAKYYRVDFVSGGEPLLNFDMIKFACRRAAELSRVIDKPIIVWACTNGTCFNDETIQMLNDTNLSIGISLDGSKEKHNSARIFRDGSGTYDTVMNAIEQITLNDSIPHRIKDAWILSVLHKDNINPVDVIEHHINCGFSTVQMTPARLPKEHPLFIDKMDMKELIFNYNKLKRKIIEQFTCDNNSILKTILNDRDYLGRIILSLLQKQKLIYRCGAGKYKISIAANGDIYPCDSFVGEESFVLGNIFNSPEGLRNAEFFSAHVFNRKPCATCWNKYLCGGDCYYNSYISTGSLIGIEENICELKKQLSIYAIEIVYSLSKNVNLLHSTINHVNRRRIVSTKC